MVNALMRSRQGMLATFKDKGYWSKEPTDINALADEYLRLSYHIRAEDQVV